MAGLNKSTRGSFDQKTHEGATASRMSKVQALRRSVMACMLWEDTFYEDGVSIAERIKSLISEVDPQVVMNIAIEAREQMKLRHVPLLIAREMSRIKTHKSLVADTLERIIQRPDELTEYLSIYWADGKCPISAQSKIGLARAFQKFNEYSLAKYNRDSEIKLRDVLFMCHAKPKDQAQADLWKKLVDDTLAIPDTWEVELSASKDKKASWERLLSEKKLFALALLKNLRNMFEAGVDQNIVFNALDEMKTERVLPFRFISASKYAPQWESHIEKSMLKMLEGKTKFPGHTVLLIDVSGSMREPISGKSDLTRAEAAAALAMLAREMCDNVSILTFNSEVQRLPDRRGFALKDLIIRSVQGSTYTGKAVQYINSTMKYDRLIIFTDEQSHDQIPDPTALGYVINVAAYQNGIGYGKWLHVDGFSEAILDFIQMNEMIAE